MTGVVTSRDLIETTTELARAAHALAMAEVELEISLRRKHDTSKAWVTASSKAVRAREAFKSAVRKQANG